MNCIGQSTATISLILNTYLKWWEHVELHSGVQIPCTLVDHGSATVPVLSSFDKVMSDV